MPISSENRKRYPPNWKEISKQIRFGRAKGRCECTGQCGKHLGARCVEEHGTPAVHANGGIILTVAHLDHVPEHCEPSNLRAMCQRCHLRYDSAHHVAARRARKADRDLFR